MPRIIVNIEWDVPDEPHWLNPDNVALALGAHCRNTAFEVRSAMDPSAEVARLREALAQILDARPEIDTSSRPDRCPQCRNISYVGNQVCPTCQGELFDCHKIARAALSTPADEPQGAEHWLEQHDEEVRAQEREQCLTRRYPIPLRALCNVMNDFCSDDDDRAVRKWLKEIDAANREGQDEISGVVGNRNENVADA